MKKLTFFLVLTSLSVALMAQAVLLDQTTDRFDSLGNKGPNQKHFFHYYFNIGHNFGKEVLGAEIKIFPSTEAGFGVRYKYRFNQHFAAVADLNFWNNTYNLKQNVSNTLPDTVIHSKENIAFTKLGAGAYLRINLDKRRGDFIGTFIDLGFRSGYVIYAEHNYSDKNKLTGITTSVKNTGFSYYEPLYYGFFGRAGFSHISAFFSYQLTPFFKSSSGLPELPPFSAGIDIALF